MCPQYFDSQLHSLLKQRLRCKGMCGSPLRGIGIHEKIEGRRKPESDGSFLKLSFLYQFREGTQNFYAVRSMSIMCGRQIYNVNHIWDSDLETPSLITINKQIFQTVIFILDRKSPRHPFLNLILTLDHAVVPPS